MNRIPQIMKVVIKKLVIFIRSCLKYSFFLRLNRLEKIFKNYLIIKHKLVIYSIKLKLLLFSIIDIVIFGKNDKKKISKNNNNFPLLFDTKISVVNAKMVFYY